MSGVVSGISKVFSSVVGGLSTSLGSAVTGVGATVATAGAATGGGLFSGGLSSIVSGLGSGGGVLGNIFNGVVNVATKGLGGLVETGMSAGKGMMSAFSGGAGDAVSLGGAAADTLGGGMAAGAAPNLLSKAGDFLMSEQGAGLVGGLGKGWAAYEQQKGDEEERQKDRDYLLAKEQRVRDSFNVPAGALADGASTGVVKDGPRPTPTQQFGGRDYDMKYDRVSGQIIPVKRA